MNIKRFLLQRLSQKKDSREFNPATFKKVLIVRPAKIGDTICMTPLIRELKKAFPTIKIDVYASTYNNFLFRHVPQVNQVYTEYRRKHIYRSLIDLFKMRSNKYDLIIDTMDIRFKKVIKLLFINADWLIANSGHSKRYEINNSDVSLYHKVILWREIHTVDRLLEFLPVLGVNNYDNTMEMSLGNSSIEYAKQFLEPYNKFRIIGLNADATDEVRSLTDSDIVSICRGINEKCTNFKILLLCSRARLDHMKGLIIKEDLKDIICEEGSRNIFDAAALVSFMNVIISTNTSFIHIASALNIPTVGIYQNNINHLKLWSPKSTKAIIVKPDNPGHSIEGFSIDETVNAATQLLN